MRTYHVFHKKIKKKRKNPSPLTHKSANEAKNLAILRQDAARQYVQEHLARNSRVDPQREKENGKRPSPPTGLKVNTRNTIGKDGNKEEPPPAKEKSELSEDERAFVEHYEGILYLYVHVSVYDIFTGY